MRIHIDAADHIFSQYIRKRDKKCMRCGSPVQFNEKGLPISHQASHYWGRGKESVRYNEFNVCCLCFSCHHYWGGEGREQYKEFMLRWLGEKKYKQLEVEAHTLRKKDRKMAIIIAKELLKKLST